jgi:hypothetical protein
MQDVVSGRLAPLELVDDVAFIENQDAVTQADCFLKLRGGKQYRHALLGEDLLVRW